MGEGVTGILQAVGLLAIVFGVAFCAIAVLGLYRLPDVYTRLHASGKVSTVGLAGLLIGAALILPAAAPKVIALTVFIVITAPVASHAIALAAYRSGVPPAAITARDDLRSRRELHQEED